MVNCQYPTNQARTPLNRPSQATQTQVAEAQQPRTRPPSWLAPTPPTEASPGQELAPDQVRSLPSSRGDSPPNRLRLHSHLDRHQRPTQRWPSWTSHHLPPTRSHQAQLVQEMLAATPPLPPSSPLPPPEESSTPAAQLVTELFQSLKAKSSPEQAEQEPEKAPPFGLKATKSNPMDQYDSNPLQQPNSTPVFKTPLKKVVPGPVANPSVDTSPPPVNFKSQLKKTNNSALYAQPSSSQEEPGVVDFKSALRKVDKPGRPGANDVQPGGAGSPELGFRAGLRSVAGGGDLHKRAPAEPPNNEEVEEEEEEEENKRKSTGSISSLVKMR